MTDEWYPLPGSEGFTAVAHHATGTAGLMVWTGEEWVEAHGPLTLKQWTLARLVQAR